MALIPILPEDIKVSSVKVHPNQHFVSSSNGGIKGDIFLFAERSQTLKEITSELEEYTFDIKSTLSVDDAGLTIRKDQKRSRHDISGLVDNYFINLGKLAGSLDNTKKLIVYRFDMPHRFNANTIRKSVFIKNLLPFYQGEYERPMSFGFSNYHSLNFFTSSAAFPSNVPSNTALIYPIPSSGSKPSRYYPSGSFSFEFYVNPRYTTDTASDAYTPGTIMHLPNCYAVSLVSGSHKDELGRPRSFRLMLQLGDHSALPPSKVYVDPKDAATGSISTRTFISADGFLEKDRWSYCAIRWGGPTQNDYTGSFYINGQNAGNFVIPDTDLSFGRTVFTDANDIPSALLIGNRYRASNNVSVDDDDLITVVDGASYTPAVPNTHASGSFKITLTPTANPSNKITREILFQAPTGSVPTDMVALNNSYTPANNVTNLKNAIVGAAVDRTGDSGSAAMATIIFTNELAANSSITIINSANVSKTYTAVNDGSSNYNDASGSKFKRGSASGTASAKAAIAAQSLKEAINAAANSSGGGHGGTIVATSAAGRVNLVQATKGIGGNKNITTSPSSITNATVPSAFTGGVTIMNPALTGLSAQIIGNDINLTYGAGRIDIFASSSVQIPTLQKASESHGNFLTSLFKPSSQNPVYGNSNSRAAKTGFLFDSGSAETFGTVNLLGDITDDENLTHSLDSPLNAELQDIRIFSRWRTDSEIKSTAETGYYDFGDKHFLFYLPPYFVPSSSVRQMLKTVTQTHYSSSHTPFNLDLSFGQGGRLLNLENFTYDLVTGTQARCYNLSATPPSGTWSDFSADDFDFMPASDAILLKPENRKRNLTILPSDLGQLKPGLSFLDAQVSKITNKQSDLFFVNDQKQPAKGMVTLRDMISMGAQYNELVSFDEETGNIDSMVDSLFPSIEVAIPVDMDKDGTADFKEIAHSKAYGQQSAIGLTVLNRTRDVNSSEIMFLDISNIFYGDMIKRESFVMHDPYVTGSAGKIKLTFRDNGTGGLYRCDASGSHPTWSSAGIILYEEGIACLTNPTIPAFGAQQFTTTFKGDRNLHILEMRVPIDAEEAKISSNPTYKKLSPTDLPSDREIGCNFITNMFIHDENLNVIGKVNLSRPIVRKDEDRYVFKFKMDF